MSISYHGVVGHTAKATLPSVDTWGSNMNILRDPPKSIQTRKIDKISDTSELTQMAQESGDRVCEGILEYARGVNPMVGVSYSNYGNNGGQRVNQSKTGGIGNAHAFLPYRIMRDGAFRPPAWSSRNLLPLSRQPRVWTSSFTQPGFVDYSKKVMCQGTDIETKGVKNPDQVLKACIRPTATYKIETPLVEPFEVKYVIQNPIKVSGHSGIDTGKRVNAESGDPDKYIVDNPLRPDVNLNMGSRETNKDINIRDFNTQKYMQDSLHKDVNVNKSRNVQITSIDEIYGGESFQNDRTKNQMNIDYTAPYKGYEKNDYIHDDIQLERVVPEHEAYTNRGQNIHKRTEHVSEKEYTPNRPVTDVQSNRGSLQKQAIDLISNREYNLKPTVNPGGYSQNVGVPTITRQQITQFDTQKTRMREKIYDLQQNRHYDNGINPYNRNN